MSASTPLARFIRAVLSMQVGLGLFALLGIVSVIGSLLPPDANLYGHPLFVTLLLVLVAHTAACTFRQLPGLIRRRHSGPARILYHWSVWFIHLSILCIGITGTVAALAYETTMVSLHEGETSSRTVGSPPLTLGLELTDLRVEHYPDGSVSDWVSTLAINGTAHEIRVNQPAVLGDVKFLQGGYQVEYALRLQTPAMEAPQNILLPQDTAVPLDRDGQLSFALSPVQPGLIGGAASGKTDAAKNNTGTDAAVGSPGAGTDGPAPAMVDLVILAGGKVVQRGAMFLGLPLQLGDTGITITVDQSRESSVFIMRYTPQLVWLWLSFGLLALSVCGLFFGKRG